MGSGVKITLVSLLLLTWVSAWAGSIVNLDKNGVILEGYDAVSYFQSNGPKLGTAKIQVQNNGTVYWFASEENKQEFLKNPAKYEPQFGAWCAYAVADSKSKVSVDPKSFLIQDGKLLLFYNGLWGNTREKWQNTKGKDPKQYFQEATTNWPEVKNKDP